MESRIYLVGFMGAGKSTVGKKLARALGYRFLDLDEKFEKRYKVNIDLFFHKYDEELFRQLESDLLKETYTMEKTVISTGGGTPCHHGGIQGINRNGLSIYLKMEPAALASRLMQAKRPRPLIKGKTGDELTRYIHQKLSERTDCYKKAHFSVDALHSPFNEVIAIVMSKQKP